VSQQLVGAGLAILSAVCGYHPPPQVEGVVLAADAMAPIVQAHTSYAHDLEMIGAALPLLKALTQRADGREAARAAGADAALTALMAKHPSEDELHAEASAVLAALAQGAPKNGRTKGRSKEVAQRLTDAAKDASDAAAPARKAAGKKEGSKAAPPERVDAVYWY
jgi:hypothetical protein